MNSRTSWPAACRYLTRAPATSPSPPALAKGTISAVAKQMRSGMIIKVYRIARRGQRVRYDVAMRRFNAYLAISLVIVISLIIGRLAADWPRTCAKLHLCATVPAKWQNH